MAAVFASYRLEASEYSSKELPSVKEALAFVEVYSERPYGPLGIQKGFNCLFLYNDGGPQGRMVPVGADEAKCTRRFDGNLDIGVRLEVRTSPLGHPALTAVDIPPVARWDRDVQNGNNYIGVKCGESWCEIGAPKFNSSAKIQLSEGAAFSNEFMRSMLIKGWYDQQALAVYSGGVLSNSRVIGTVFPFSHLERYSIGVGDPNFGLDGQWRPAAHVFVPAEMKDYVSKLNLSRADLPTVVANNTQPSLNLIEMCHGTREECAVPSNQAQRCENRLKRSGVVPSWWARITAAGKGTPRIRHFCIMYRGHPDIPRIPGTVRWRWSATDEVIWIRCPAGCCEVEEDT